MTYCTQCGKPLQQDDANFCTACGARLTPAPADAPPPPAYEPPTDTPPPPAYEPPVDVPSRPAYVPPTDAPPRPAYVPPADTPPPPAPPVPLSADRATFRDTWLGFVLIGILLVAALVMCFFSPKFFIIQNLEHTFLSFVTFAIIGFSAVLSSRAKGPDLSVGYVAGLTSVIFALTTENSEPLYTGLIIAVAVGMAIGLVNGVCSVFLRIPAVIVTLITGFVAYFVGALITNGRIITPGLTYINDIIGLEFLLLIVSFVLAFLLVLFTWLGKPSFKRDKKAQPPSFVFAYVVSSVIAVLAGFSLMLRLDAAIPSIGSFKEIPILFIFSAVYSSRALDNRFAPVLFSLVPALVWTLLSSGLVLLGVGTYIQDGISAAITLVFVVMAYVCRYKRGQAPSLD